MSAIAIRPFAVFKPPAGAQINYSHTLGSQIVGAWFDLEGFGNQSFEMTGRYAGTLVGSIARVPSDRFGMVWSVASGKYVSAPLSWAGRAEPFTVSTWFKPTNVATATQGIFQWAGAAASGTPMLLIQNNSGNLRIYFADGYQETSQTLTSGLWYHVVVTWSGGNRWRCYLNGRLLSTSALTIAQQSTATSVWMGNGFNVSFTGLLGPTVIWRKELGPETVKQLYQEPFAMLRTRGFTV